MANTPDELVGLYVKTVASVLPAKVQPKVQAALRMIESPALETLALRRYIRKAKDLDAQWVWSDEKIQSFETDPKAARVRFEVAKVKEKFKELAKKKFPELNPGYTLEVSPIRDLNRQVALWKGNKTVYMAAEDLMRKCRLEIVQYPDQPNLQSTEKFRLFLGHCAVHPEPTSAAPGLSDHGQMNAIDFVVLQGRKKIADTKTASIGLQWDAPGWTQMLRDAVTQSNSLFIGPLEHPREPWHYSLPH